MAVHTIPIYTRARLTLIDILADVCLGIKAKSRRTLAGETPRRVPALTIFAEQPVHQTLIDINAAFPCQVYFKTFIAGAFVRPQHVLTYSVLTDVRVEGTLINISSITGRSDASGAQSQELGRALWWARLAGLSVGVFCAGTAALRLGHSPKERLNTLPSLVAAVTRTAHVRVNTDPSIQAHCHPSHTLTAEGSLSVDTVAVHAHARSLTFIDVYTHASAGVEIEPRFTDASEAPIFIDAQSIEAHVPDQTLIQVLTVFAILRNFKSSIADTVEAAFSVHTAAIVANTTIGHTLVQISALGSG